MNRNLKFNLDAKSPIEVTDGGFLKVDSFVTREGIFPYNDGAGGLFREYRSEKEVFSEDSLKTLKGIPITFLNPDGQLKHPTEKVNSDNFKKYTVGVTGENIRKVVEDGISHVAANLTIMDADVISFIKDKRDKGESVELSCGYNTKVVPQQGTHDKEGRYDGIQTNIRYNHVSIVEKGRAGESVRMKLDIKDEESNKPTQSKEDTKKMKFIKKLIKTKSFNMDAMDVEVADGVMAPLNTLSTKVDEAVVVIEAGEVKIDALTTEVEDLKTKLDEAEKAKADTAKENEELSNLDSDRIQKMLKARADMDEVAGLLGVKHLDDKDARKDSKVLRDEIIALHTQDASSLKDKDDAYLDARYDTISDAVFKAKKDGTKNDGLAAFNLSAVMQKKDGQDKVDPAQKFKEDTKDMHKVEDK